MNQEQVGLVGHSPMGLGVQYQMPVVTSDVDPSSVNHMYTNSIDASLLSQQPQQSQLIATHSSAVVPEAFPPMAETYAPTYDDMFPSLPIVEPSQLGSGGDTNGTGGRWSNKMKVKSSNITSVFRVAPEERKYRETNGGFADNTEQTKICQEIMQNTSTHIETSNSKDGTLTFLITGKEDAVLQAKKMISTELQTQASASLSIPKDHHRFILGKAGKRLAELESATGTKIYVPRQTDASEQIKIIGTKEAIDKAIHEIQLTSNEAASRANERIQIPKEYHAFIVGPYNENLNKLINETGAKINIPPGNLNKDEISISGESNAVALAKEKILAIYEEKKRKCQTVSMEVKKSQHKYIIGPKGSTIQEIFKTTGVSVEMPPSSSDTETITLRGEQDKLGPALTVLYEKAHSEVERSIEAESWIQKHILGPKGSKFHEICAENQAVHNISVSFDGQEGKIKMRGPRADVEKAQLILEKHVAKIRSEITLHELKVPSKFHRFIIGKNGQNIRQIREETGAQIHVPSETDNSASGDIVRIEGSPEGVERAHMQLEAIIKKLVERENEVSKDLIIDQRFHRQIIGSKGENIRDVRDRFNQVIINFPESNTKSDKVTIRGSKEDVEQCYKFLAQKNKELLANNYRVEVPIFKQHHKYIIGKEGATIRKIRDETGVKIELPAEGSNSDVIVITGKKESVELAKTKIQQIQEDLADVVQVDIIIPAKFHNSIIGAKGRLIRSIMEECGGVIIKFPPEGSGSDKVSIRGPKDCVVKAKQQLIELSNEKQTNSFTEEVKAKPEYHRFLIGKNGVNIKKVRESTGARIFFPSEKEAEENPNESDTIVLMGKKESVQKAKKELENLVRDLEKVVDAEIEVSPKHHKHFVSRRGAVLKEIIEECGGVSISFPRNNDRDNSRVTLKGAKEFVEAAKAKIQEIVDDLEAEVSIDCVIDQQHHRVIMGSRGSNVQSIQQKYNVHIKFPERGANGVTGEDPDFVNGDMHGSDDNISSSDISESRSPRRRLGDVITIRGRLENCEAAKEELLSSIPIVIDVEVPFDYHRFIIGQKGSQVREMMEKYDVQISVPPHSQQSDTIKITGIREKVEGAKEAILERVQKLEEEKQDRDARSFRVQIRVDPSYHPKIIGKKGAIITRIRNKYDVQIQFPERFEGQADQDLISIIGYEKNANEAAEEIQSIVRQFEDQTSEEIEIDHRVHPRLIGAKGRNIKKIMDKYKVDIRFPRSSDANPNLVVISGDGEAVDAVKDHLLNLTEEYLDDVVEQYKPPRNASDADENRPSGEKKGFYVKGGPWEQQQQQQQQIMPDTNDTEEFPTMGNQRVNSDTPKTRWGPRSGPV